MLNPKKTIPALITAALALTGCEPDDDPPGDGGSGGDGGTGGTGGVGGVGGAGGGLSEAVVNALRGFCMKVNECYPEDGYTLEECVDYYTNYYAPYFDLDNPDCESALVSYLDCNAALSCVEFTMFPNSCEADGEALDPCFTIESNPF